MKCTRCKSEIGEIKECYTNICKLSSRTGLGMILCDVKGQAVGWLSEEGMICKNCRPSVYYTNRNWSFPNASEHKQGRTTGKA